MITEDDHKKRHIELHKSLDELFADFIEHNELPFTSRPIKDLLDWAHKQTVELDHKLKSKT